MPLIAETTLSNVSSQSRLLPPKHCKHIKNEGIECKKDQQTDINKWRLIVITYVDPRVVPRMVWGLRNLQHASLKSKTLFSTGSDPADPTWVQAWQHPLHINATHSVFSLSNSNVPNSDTINEVN